MRVLGSSQAVEQRTNSVHLHSFMGGQGSMLIQATSDLGIWRRLGNVGILGNSSTLVVEGTAGERGIRVTTSVCV